MTVYMRSIQKDFLSLQTGMWGCIASEKEKKLIFYH